MFPTCAADWERLHIILHDNATARESEHVVRPMPLGHGIFTTHLIGPRNPKGGGDLRVDITLKVDPRRPAHHYPVRRHTQRDDPHQGEWSDWLQVKFKVGCFSRFAAWCDFICRAVNRSLRCMPRRLTLIPHRLPFQLATRPICCRARRRIGLYYTTGMVEDHAGLNNERISETTYLDQCEIVWRKREAMMITSSSVQ